MKKIEEVEVAYVRRTTMLIVGVISLAVGFIGGIIYKNIAAGPKTDVRKETIDQRLTQSQSPQTQQAGQLLELRKKVANNPQDAQTWADLGNLYFDINEYDNAINAYKKHLELNPQNANVWTDLGVMYRRSGRSAEAIQAFSKAIEFEPRHQQSRFNKGIVLMYDMKDQQAAIKVWEDLLTVNPAFKIPDGRSLGDFIQQLRSTSPQ